MDLSSQQQDSVPSSPHQSFLAGSNADHYGRAEDLLFPPNSNTNPRHKSQANDIRQSDPTPAPVQIPTVPSQPAFFYPVQQLPVPVMARPQILVYAPAAGRVYLPSAEQRKKAIRAERNRFFARESRERRRTYLQSLEKEVASLKEQLELYKTRLEKYEVIERQRCMAGEEDHKMIVETIGEMQRTGTDPSKFAQIITRKMEELGEERQAALEQLSQITLEIAVPRPLRLFLWQSEAGIDMYDPEGLNRLMGYKVSPDDVKYLKDREKFLPVDRETWGKMLARAASSAQAIRRYVRRVIDAQRGIQMEALKVWKEVKRKMMPNYGAEYAEMKMKCTPKLNGRPELSNAEIFKLGGETFWLDENTADCLEDDIGESPIAAREGDRINI